MGAEDVKEEKKITVKGWEGKQKLTVYKPFKRKVECLESAVFKSGAVKHAAQFMKMLEEITNYIQKKYNSDVVKMIKDMEYPTFEFPVWSVPRIILNPDGTSIQEKIDKMDIYVWKKDYELVHNKKAKFKKKEKQVFQIILDQCLPSLRCQLEGAKTFKEACEKWHHGIVEAYLRILLQTWPDQW